MVRVHLAKGVTEHKSPSFKAYCGYQLGVAYDMLGEKDKAAGAFAPVPSWVRKVIHVANRAIANNGSSTILGISSRLEKRKSI